MGAVALGRVRKTRTARTLLRPGRDTCPRFCAVAHAVRPHGLTGAAVFATHDRV